MKKISLILTLALILSLLAGCAGTPVVYYTNCTCPTGGQVTPTQPQNPTEPTQPPVVTEGALKLGLYIGTGMGDSKSASDANGEAKYDVTIVAVLVDDNGVIADCIIDGIAASVAFVATGTITSDVTAPVQTKNELGENYGMMAWGGAIAEWDDQAAALASFAIGKTVAELRNGAIDENTGKAPEGSDLGSSATIYLAGYVSGIEAAVANAQHLGAQSGDVLKLAVIASADGSTSASADSVGSANLNVDVTALTVKDEVITSCVIDSVQAKVSFDNAGQIASDLSEPVLTKNQLGENYGMVHYGGAIAEWNEQAASFASYVMGKTAAEVAGIAVTEGKPADADLAASVTIAIGGFQALIAKALQ